MIRLEHVTKQYHYSDSKVLDDVTLDIPQGISTLLVDVQSGKSTIAKLLLNIEQATSGSIYVLGEVAGSSRDIAFIDSSLLLWQGKSVLKNLIYPLTVRGIGKKQAIAQATAHAEQCALSSMLSVKVSKLSLADQINVAVARATIRPLQLVILDSLDSVCDEGMWHSIIDILTSHCDNVFVLTSNSARAVGSVAVLQDNKVVHTGSASSARQVLSDSVWLYNKIGEYSEQ